jgi:alcohol dehydrogenase class IV
MMLQALPQLCKSQHQQEQKRQARFMSAATMSSGLEFANAFLGMFAASAKLLL